MNFQVQHERAGCDEDGRSLADEDGQSLADEDGQSLADEDGRVSGIRSCGICNSEEVFSWGG